MRDFFPQSSRSDTQGVKQGPLPVLQMLDASQTLEATVHHDGHACTQCFTLFHAMADDRESTFQSKVQ